MRPAAIFFVLLLFPLRAHADDEAVLAADHRAVDQAELSGDPSQIIAAIGKLSQDRGQLDQGNSLDPIDPLPPAAGPVRTGTGRLAVLPKDACVRFTGCIDGSDAITIQKHTLTQKHSSFAQIGTHASCPSDARFAGGGYLINGVPVPAEQKVDIGMDDLNAIKIISARGNVLLDKKNTVVFDDTASLAAAKYEVDLCPSPNPS